MLRVGTQIMRAHAAESVNQLAAQTQVTGPIVVGLDGGYLRYWHRAEGRRFKLVYLARNAAALVHYTALRRRGEPVATPFVESAVDEIVARRMKAQPMRWSRATVQPFLDVRTAVLNGTLEHAFRCRHPGF
ncbi:MAG: hypothetical protein JOY65_15285 [Acetobacteraceae bacterium]|nr:hypothetical protein [Acetobacteraceae bacterium]